MNENVSVDIPLEYVGFALASILQMMLLISKTVVAWES